VPVLGSFGALSSRAFGFGAGAASTLSPTDKAAGITLSNGNLTATNTSGTVSNVRSTTSRGSGSYHVEFAIVNTGGRPSYPAPGFGNGSASLTLDMGQDANSCSYDRSGAVFYNGVNLGAVDAFTSGAVLALEIALGTSQLWVQLLGGTGRKGPFSVSGLSTPIFVMVGTKGLGEAVTVNFGAAPFSITPTSGFSPWG
jgi:hypothetical protein